MVKPTGSTACAWQQGHVRELARKSPAEVGPSRAVWTNARSAYSVGASVGADVRKAALSAVSASSSSALLASAELAKDVLPTVEVSHTGYLRRPHCCLMMMFIFPVAIGP
jgi:hypothetical protein